MKHQRVKDIAKVTARRKLWDLFSYGYMGQQHRLWKRHWLKCNCRMCALEREYKRLAKKRERVEGLKASKDVLNYF